MASIADPVALDKRCRKTKRALLNALTKQDKIVIVQATVSTDHPNYIATTCLNPSCPYPYHCTPQGTFRGSIEQRGEAADSNDIPDQPMKRITEICREKDGYKFYGRGHANKTLWICLSCLEGLLDEKLGFIHTEANPGPASGTTMRDLSPRIIGEARIHEVLIKKNSKIVLKKTGLYALNFAQLYAVDVWKAVHLPDTTKLNTIDPSDWTNIRIKNMISSRGGLRFPTEKVKKNYQKLAGWSGYVDADEFRNEKLDYILSIEGTWEAFAKDRPHYEHQGERELHGENRYQHREERERQRLSQPGRVWSTTQELTSQEEEGDNTSECSTEEVMVNWDAIEYQDLINKNLPLYPSDSEDEYLPADSQGEGKAGKKRMFHDMNMSEESGEDGESDFEGCDSKEANLPMKTRSMTQKEVKETEKAKLRAAKKSEKKAKKMKIEKVNTKAERKKDKGKGRRE